MATSNKLIDYLSKFGALSNKDIELLSENLTEKNFTTGDVFTDAGKVTHEIGFVLSGVFRYFFYDKDGNEVTASFMAEDEFVTHINSFNEYVPSPTTIMAETDCSVIIISREAWELFSANIPNWNAIIQSITSRVLVNQTNFQRRLIHQSAKTSYLNFLKQYPTVVQNVPLVHIASYLGITKSSLSRIRKQITGN